MEKLFSPDKTMDLAMAGMSGYGKAGIAKESLEYQTGVEDDRAKGWSDAYGSRANTIKPTYRSQGGSY